MKNKLYPDISTTLRNPPTAHASIFGSEKYPDIVGEISFYQSELGVLAVTRVSGLPRGSGECDSPVFGFHIHSGGECSGNDADPFANTDGHYDTHTCRHPYHSGDMPPLFSADGRAFSAFLTQRITIDEIIGKSVVIHAMPDDFHTQPSGASGEKIACGVIRKINFQSLLKKRR